MLAKGARYDEAEEDVLEIERLLVILNEDAQKKYWENQGREVQR